MKTPEDIISEFDGNEEYPSYYHESMISIMMKEYACQWVDKLAKDLNKNQGYGSMHPESIVEDIKKQIDAQ